MSKTRKILIAVVVLILLVALAGTAVVLAHTLDERSNAPTAGVLEQSIWQEQASQKSPGGPNIDYDALLAEALDITVEELQSARGEAFRAAVEQAVDEGYLAPNRADKMLAVHAMRQYLDLGELAAKALGISIEELQEVRQERQFRQLLEDLEMTPADVRDAVREQFEITVDNAFEQGVITEGQAELLKEQPGLMLRNPRRVGRYDSGPGDHAGRGPGASIRRTWRFMPWRIFSSIIDSFAPFFKILTDERCVLPSASQIPFFSFSTAFGVISPLIFTS